MLSQMPRSFTTRFQFVPTCERVFGGILSWAQTSIRSFTDRQKLGTSWEQISYIGISGRVVWKALVAN
jgi:hypothetical protein